MPVSSTRQHDGLTVQLGVGALQTAELHAGGSFDDGLRHARDERVDLLAVTCPELLTHQRHLAVRAVPHKHAGKREERHKEIPKIHTKHKRPNARATPTPLPKRRPA